ncbi:MAG TPA: hypothetical protein VJ813_14910 [Vicinamibacterales bacterium]|nr:hypothetical protein [Vicinamibacterales bacterium]
MRALIIAAAAVVIAASATPARAQDPAAHVRPALKAFEHYEGVRRALSADTLADVATHAKRLAEQAEGVGGAAAKKSAEKVAAAKTLDDARTAFGELSSILVPVFQAEKIPGTTAYICPMNQKPWVQRGDKMENPYYGKSMLTCGSVLPPKSK